MNTKLLLLFVIVAGFTSCSTAYKAGQTPDDVYYSPVRPQNDYVRTNQDETKPVYQDNTVYGDPNIRTRTHYRRWRRYNDYEYNYPYGNQYPPVYVDPYTGKSTTGTPKTPRKVNLGAYKKPADTTASANSIKNIKSGTTTPPSTTSTSPVRTFKQPTRTGSGVGNILRRVFSGTSDGSSRSNNGDNSSSSSNTRTFSGSGDNTSRSNSGSGTSNTNSSSNSNTNSNSGSGSSSAPVRTFDKK